MLNRAMNQCYRRSEFMSNVRKEGYFLFRCLFYLFSHHFQLFVLHSQFLGALFYFLFEFSLLLTITLHFSVIKRPNQRSRCQ